ncbi:MAG: TetR/AcrR family transcriptional regulator [Dehalococcoidia bacterium]
MSTPSAAPEVGIEFPAGFVSRAGGDKPRRERTRTKIVEAAGGLFRDAGFAETSMQAIADATGMGVGTLYGYFVSKDEILREVLYAQAAVQSETYRAAVAAVPNGLDRLLFSFDLLMEYIDQNRAIIRGILEVHHPEEEARAQPLEWLFQSARALLLAGQAQGHIRPLPIDTTARLIVGAALSAGLGQGAWRGVESDAGVRAELRLLIRELVAP